MKSKTELRQELERIHRKSYPAYKDLRGQYDFGDYVYALSQSAGGSVRVPVQCQCGGSHEKGGIPGIVLEEAYARTALEDCLLRRFAKKLQDYSFKAKGSGKSGLIATSRPGQEILRRTSAGNNGKKCDRPF